jgi:hypothetical protein
MDPAEERASRPSWPLPHRSLTSLPSVEISVTGLQFCLKMSSTTTRLADRCTMPLPTASLKTPVEAIRKIYHRVVRSCKEKRPDLIYGHIVYDHTVVGPKSEVSRTHTTPSKCRRSNCHQGQSVGGPADGGARQLPSFQISQVRYH